MKVQCNVCGKIFESGEAENNGCVYFEGHVIGLACTPCQKKIWDGSYAYKMPGM